MSEWATTFAVYDVRLVPDDELIGCYLSIDLAYDAVRRFAVDWDRDDYQDIQIVQVCSGADIVLATGDALYDEIAAIESAPAAGEEGP